MTLLKVKVGVPMKQIYIDKNIGNKLLIIDENSNIHI